MGAPGARILIESSLGGTPYVARALELLDIAERGISSESCVVWSEHGGVVHTVALVGLLMDALNGGGQIHLLLGDDRHIVARACEVLRALGARYAIAEWPDEAPFTDAITLLREEGFAVESRVRNSARPAGELVILRREL